MAWVLTDYGARLIANLITGRWTDGDSRNTHQVYLLGAAPPLDRTKVALSDYTVITDVVPTVHDLLTSAASMATIVEQRAVVQWGPPAYTFTVGAAATVYGIMVATDEGEVQWFDRFTTPISLEAGQTIQVLPAFRATSECPPLGGC